MSRTLSTLTSSSTRSTLASIWVCMRPHQWMKNLLVLVPVVFLGHLFDPALTWRVCLSFASFCLASSAVYLFNDIRDRDLDRRHPRKMHRPLCSGELSVRKAVVAMVLLAVAGLALAGACNRAFLAIVALYLLQNVAYSCGLKRVVILDVMLVANGFLLRAAGGSFAIDVVAPPWLVLCTLTLALLVALGKRRYELTMLGTDSLHRHTLTQYSPEYLDQAMSIAAAAAIVTYSRFTLSDYALDNYDSYSLVLSVPMLLYAVFRFVFLVRQEGSVSDPTRLLIMDKPMLFNGLLWMCTCVFAVYGPSEWLPWWRFGLEPDVTGNAAIQR